MRGEQEMWAIQYRRYGGPEVLEVGKVPIGSDFVGTVVRTGGRVPGVEIGDRVWGYLGMQPPGRHAAAARYVAVRADRIVRCGLTDHTRSQAMP